RVLLHRFLWRDLELKPAIIVGLDGGGNVEIGEGNLLCAVVENVHRLAHDGVVAYFLLVSVAKDEHARLVGLGLPRGGLLLWNRLGRSRRNQRGVWLAVWVANRRLLNHHVGHRVVWANWRAGVQLRSTHVIVAVAVHWNVIRDSIGVPIPTIPVATPPMVSVVIRRG